MDDTPDDSPDRPSLKGLPLVEAAGGPAESLVGDALHPRDLDPEVAARLVERMAAIFNEDPRVRDRAAIDLVDFGPPGAQALLRVLRDGELSENRAGLVALLHTLADFLSLEIPEDLQRELLEAGVSRLAQMEDDAEGATWTLADTIAEHGLSSRGERVRDKLVAALVRVLEAPHLGGRLGAVYALARLADPAGVKAMRDLSEVTADPDMLRYLRATLGRLDAGEEPEVFTVGK